MLPQYHPPGGPAPLRHFLVSYDLHKVRDYGMLISTLRRAKAVRVHKSTWLLTIRAAAGPVLKALMRLIDNDDSVAVFQLVPGADWAAIRTEPGSTNWLSSRIAKGQPLAA